MENEATNGIGIKISVNMVKIYTYVYICLLAAEIVL